MPSNEQKVTQVSELFRPQALDAQQRKNEGRKSIAIPLSFSLLTGSLFALLLLFFLTLNYAEYARKELVEGRLVPIGDFAEVYSAKKGVVQQLFVNEGQVVKRGGSIALITSELYTEQGDSMANLLSDELKTTEKLILSGIDKEIQLTQSVLMKYQQEINFKNNALQGINELITISNKKLALTKTSADNYKKLLDSKQIPNSQFESAYQQYLTQDSQVNRLVNEQTALKSDIARIESDQQVQKLVSQRNVTTLRLRLSQTRRQLAVDKVDDTYLIKAPLSGVISGLQLRKGQQVGTTTSLLTILPDEYRLEAEMFIPTRAIAFVKPDTQVNIRYHSFPYQKFGSFLGKIKSVSKNVVKSGQLTGYRGKEKWLYKLVVSLEPIDTERAIELQPGMELSAYIMGEKRSMFEWIFEPLLSVKGNVL
jgi:membrane fusion protein